MEDAPVYVPMVMPMSFDVLEAERRREAYEAARREHTRLWRQGEGETDA